MVVAAVLLQVQADIARDALQHFAILSGKDDKTKGRILRASKALQRLLNYDLDTPFPRDLSVFWGANTDRAAVDEITASIKSNRPYSGEVLCYKHTGQTVWCEISLQAIAINQDVRRLQLQPGHGAVHRQQGGLQDVDGIDLGNSGTGNRPGQSALTNSHGKGLSS